MAYGKYNADLDSRGPISIFGPIFKVEDQSKDPDLRISEKDWRSLVEGEESRKKKDV